MATSVMGSAYRKPERSICVRPGTKEGPSWLRRCTAPQNPWIRRENTYGPAPPGRALLRSSRATAMNTMPWTAKFRISLVHDVVASRSRSSSSSASGLQIAARFGIGSTSGAGALPRLREERREGHRALRGGRVGTEPCPGLGGGQRLELPLAEAAAGAGEGRGEPGDSPRRRRQT